MQYASDMQPCANRCNSNISKGMNSKKGKEDQSPKHKAKAPKEDTKEDNND